ncbi:MAG: M14 family zinc carboxypeptidase, partial [Bacteroidota bacterium]
PAISSPEKHFGYALGAEYTVYAHVVDYIKTLAAQSDRVSINQYGTTYEGRPLYNLVISSAENSKRLDQLQEDNLRLVNSASLSAQKAEQLMETLPVFTSISYNIHGNEASPTPAALQVAYCLAAATDAFTQELLDQTVVILYICINPDGRDRYIHWYKSVQRNVLGFEPRDLEHYAPWPNGRTNHYWFDLNRDWIWGIHPESRGHTAVYQRWMPQVHVDYHEQGYNSNYFTAPGTTPRNLLLPEGYEALSDTFGRANIAAFDQNKISYATREAFDFFYPGYGSSYPSVMGAIGMLTEQGGIAGGRAVETNDGFVLTLRQRIFDHYTTSLATIRKAVERRQMLRRYAYEAYQPKNSKSIVKAYLFPPQAGTYLTDVLRMLQRQGVEIRQTSDDFSSKGKIKDFRTGKLINNLSVPKGTFIVSTNQPRHLFINSVLQRNLAIEDSVMYDMSSWAAPLAYNLDAYYTEQSWSVNSEVLTTIPSIPSGVIHAEAKYAYVIDWKQRHAPKALAMIWKKGYRVRSTRKTFSNGQQDFSEGSLVVLLGRNRDKLDQVKKDMEEIAKVARVEIYGMDTGRMMKGIDLSSRDARPVKQPRVALLVEPPFSSYTCGQIYFLFDQETQLPVERVRTSILKQTAMPKFGARYGYADLNDYDVLILSGGGEHLGKLFNKQSLKALQNWVSAGGILVATESAAPFFTQQKSKMTKVKLLDIKKDSSDRAAYIKFEDRRDYFGKKRIPGAALNAQIDTSHPLAFGMKDQLYSLKFGHQAFQASPEFETVGYYEKEVSQLLAAGYASEENLEHLAGKSFAGVMPMGAGKVVFLLDNTQYRMFWRGPSRMMQNAVMLLKGM